MARSRNEFRRDHRGDPQPGCQALGEAHDIETALGNQRGDGPRRRRQQIGVGVIFDQISVVLAHDCGNGVPPCLRHDGAGRCLQRRHAIDHARAGFGESEVEAFRHQALAIGRDPLQAIGVLHRQSEHAGIGECLGEDGVAGLGDHSECDGERVLAAMRDENLLGIAGHSERCEPADDGLAVLTKALMRQIAEQFDISPVAAISPIVDAIRSSSPV